MRVFVQSPCPALRPFVNRFLVVEFPVACQDRHLPDTGPVAAFTFRGRCRLDGRQWAPAAAFTGLHETVRRHEHVEKHGVVLAVFEPMGAAAFLRPALEDFSGGTTDLAGVLAPADCLDELLGQIQAAPNHARRVMVVEAFLRARLRQPAPDPLVAAAVRWVALQPGAGRIAALTRHIGLSQSALERRFRRTVGVTPKKFGSVVRFRHAVQLLAPGADLASVALSAGYFDQSHFINHFRRTTGRTPAEFVHERGDD